MNSSNVVVDLVFYEKETLQDCIFLFVTDILELVFITQLYINWIKVHTNLT